MDEKQSEGIEPLVVEAERRVRAGEPRASVAASLGIPISTLAGWAQRGGWRRKDLIAVRNAERGEAAMELIAILTAEDHAQQQLETAKMREALEASKAEFEAAAPNGRLPGAQLAGPMGEGAIPARKLAMAMADSLLREGRLDESDRAIRLAVRFAEAEHAASTREEAKWREERERTMMWWAEKQTAYHKLHTATDFLLEQFTASAVIENSRMANHCCPKCGRRMDFWPEEIDRPYDDDSGADSGDGDSGRADFRSDDSGLDDFRRDDSGGYSGHLYGPGEPRPGDFRVEKSSPDDWVDDSDDDSGDGDSGPK